MLCVFDLSVNGFDLLNDFVGMIMITRGVFQVGKINVHDRYSTAMFFVKIMAVLGCFQALEDRFCYRVPTFLSIIMSVISSAFVVTPVVFCVAMGWLSVEANLERSVASWRTTTILCTVIYGIPLGMLYCAATVAIATGQTFYTEWNAAGPILLPVFFAPLVYLFVSTSRMKNETQMSTPTGQPDALLD